MTNRVIGPGVGLPPPQVPYPASLYQIPYTAGSNELSLAPGQSVQLPAGDWMVSLGKYCVLQVQDPVESPSAITQQAGVWRTFGGYDRGMRQVRSDGVNYRVANLTGCIVGAVVSNYGKNYVLASTTITPSSGTSTWQPIVGGTVDGISCTVVGANYGLAPIVVLSTPPAPGIQASAVATISAGAINGFTVINQGAGYTSAPTVTILPNPFDQNAYNGTAITQAVAAAHLTGGTTAGGSLTGALCTNPGIPVATTVTLTVAGAGTSATLSPQFLTTITALTVAATGSGTVTGVSISTIGGVNGISTASGVSNPSADLTGFLPRQLQATATVAAGAVTANTGVIIDGGLYIGTVAPIVGVYGGNWNTAANNAATFTLTQGGANDTIMVQPL